MANINLYQIFYDEETRNELDPGFIPLDNLANERPDWREYWPIRKFLIGRDLAQDDYYGFFSPKFNLKTGLSAAQARDFIEHHGNNADVVTFSPYFDMSALFTNVFEQGERYHPGLWKTTQHFLDGAGLGLSINAIVTDSRNTVYCNYFAAKPRFWIKWLEISERLFQVAENASGDGDLRKRLQAKPGYDDQVEMKVFVLERVATLILATSKDYSTRACPLLSFMFADIVSHDCILETVCSDALKIAWVEKSSDIYRDNYYRLRQAIGRKLGDKA